MDTQIKLFKVLNIFAFTAMLAVNVLAQTVPLGGLTTSEISALYPTLLTPVGLTFGIWSVIYLLIGCFIIQQTVSDDPGVVKSAGWLFCISCALNIAWIFFWHYQIMLFATIAIAALWVCLMLLSKKIDSRKWYNRAAFKIYFAWITVACAIQLYIYLAAKFPVFHVADTAVSVTIAVLVALTVYAMLAIIRKRDYYTGATIAWAMIGIFISHAGEGYNYMYPQITVIAGFCTMAIIIIALMSGLNSYKKGIMTDR